MGPCKIPEAVCARRDGTLVSGAIDGTGKTPEEVYEVQKISIGYGTDQPGSYAGFLVDAKASGPHDVSRWHTLPFPAALESRREGKRRDRIDGRIGLAARLAFTP